MNQINKRRELFKCLRDFRTPFHVTHADVIVKIWSNGAATGVHKHQRMWAFTVSVNGDAQTDHHFTGKQDDREWKQDENNKAARREFRDAVASILFTKPISQGGTYVEWVNQKYRTVEVLKINRTRFRVVYDLPSGKQRAWRKPTFTRNGDKYCLPQSSTSPIRF